MKSCVVFVALFVSASSVLGQNPNPVAESSLSAIPKSGFLVVSLNFAKLKDHAIFKALQDSAAARNEIDPGTWLEKFMGVAFADIERLTLYMPSFGRRPGAVVILIHTRKPYDREQVLKNLGLDFAEDDNVHDVRVPFSFVDERTLLFLGGDLHDEGAMIQLVAQLMNRKSEGPLASALAAAPNRDIVIGLNVAQFADTVLQEGEDAPENVRELAVFEPLLKAKYATVLGDFENKSIWNFKLNFPDETTAKAAARALQEGFEKLRSTKRDDAGPRLHSLAAVLLTLTAESCKDHPVAVDGVQVVATAAISSDNLAKTLAEAQKAVSRQANELRAMNNLKQLALGMHNFAATYDRFPGDDAWSAGGEDSTLISWRVKILPFLEQDELFRMLDPNKPFEENLKILEAAEMPKVFEHPTRPAPKNHTYFRIFSFPKNAKGQDRPLLEYGQAGPRLSDITDGTSLTYMIVEAEEAVPWYKADLLPYDGQLPLPGLGAKNSDTFLVVMCDGSVRRVNKKKIKEKDLRAFITRSSGEVVSDDPDN